MKSVLTIAGSDSSGGAGIQADIKTITCHNVFASSAITALTAQNTMGVVDIMDVTPEFLDKQLISVFEDIYPDAVKIGMVSNKSLIKTIIFNLKKFKAKNIVLDPVMVSTSGSRLINEDSINCLINNLFPLAEIVTPNILEAEIISKMKIISREDMEKAAIKISNLGVKSVLIKGGHAMKNSDDLLCKNNKFIWFNSPRIDNDNNHGTGCTLSSAIASNLALGRGIEESVLKSKEYISSCLRANLNLGQGSGPLNHMCNISIKN